MRVWVNFAELRKKLNFEDVLRHYGVEVKKKGVQHQGFCPLPGHSGKKASPSFSANLERGIFRCFGCGAQGNQLEFAALMTGVNPEDGDALRSVAVELQQKFFPEGTGGREKPRADAAPAAPKGTPVKINEPLDFELKNLDSSHPYLAGRKITPETARHFGIGVCSRGLLEGKLAIPLRNAAGELLGYAGRVIDDASITEDNPRYRLPSRRERNGTVYQFEKSLFVYNGYRFREPLDDLAVVEGFPSVWWLTQHGLPWTVALMGAECSDEQAEAIVRLVKPNGRVWLASDGDKAGIRLAEKFLPAIAPHRLVRWVQLEEGRQPTDLEKPELLRRFAL